MSYTAIQYKAQRTESMEKQSATLQSLIDSAIQVRDVLHDVSSRASHLDAKSDDTFDVIDDSSRLAAVLDALCSRHPRYARFLWIAGRNLVRDVVDHVAFTDLHPPVKVTEDETDLHNGRRPGRRAAAELDLFHGHDTHLAYGDWLEAVATSRHPSPNHDLCCRLLAHIPLLAAYTGWPTEYHLHVNSQAGTPLFQTTNDNGSINPTERANSDVAGLNSEDHQRVNWRPSEKDKKYIEETVRSLVDREDLCRLLMVAMATELERPTSLEYEDDSCCTAEKSLRHVVQSSVDSLPGDRDHGDASTTHGVPAYKHEEPSSLQQFCGLQKSSAALGDIGEQLMENVEYGLDEVGTDAVVFEDGKSESLGAVSSTSSSTNSTSALRAEIGVQETHSGELIGNNSVWLSPKSCDKDSEKSPRRFLQTSNSLGVELRDAIRTMENAELTEFEQACSKLNSQTSYNPSHWTAVAQTADNKNTTWCSRSSLAQNLEALSISATNTSHADSHVQLSVKPQSRTTELHLQPANYTLDSGVNAKEFDDGNISSTEPHRLFDLYNEKEEKHTDGFDHYDYSVKAVLGFQLMENRIKSLAEGDRDGTEEEPQSARRTGELMADECIG